MTHLRGTDRRTKAPPVVTFRDFCILVGDGQKADLLDGVIYMASPDSIDNNKLTTWLLWILESFRDEKELGGMFNFLRVAYRIDDLNSPEPDIAFIGPEKMPLARKGFIDGPPDLALEIVSPDSITRDYEAKRAKYEQAGVGEYWILDPLQDKVTLLRRGRDGTYKDARPRQGWHVSRVLPGFRFRPDWFWERPLPNKRKILRDILAG